MDYLTLLLLLQVIPASFSGAWGLLWFEWIRWVHPSSSARR